MRTKKDIQMLLESGLSSAFVAKLNDTQIKSLVNRFSKNVIEEQSIPQNTTVVTKPAQPSYQVNPNSKTMVNGVEVDTTGGKTVEITDTDAEGRLCLADGFEFIQLNLTPGKDLSKCLILDIATLTGNTTSISNGISSLILSNNTGSEYSDKLMAFGEETGEYLDYLKIRPEYMEFLTSKVADIRNLPKNAKAGCIIAGCFLNYFINPAIPWIHIDLGKGTYVNEVAQSHGINLLFEFIKNIN